MSTIIYALLFLFGVVALLIAMDFYNNYQLRQRVRRAWGQQPNQPRADKEDSLKGAWQYEKKFHAWDSEIDDITWYDLDMFTVFQLINNTYSSVGSEALYQRLRNFNFSEAGDLEEVIAFYEENPQTREQIQYYFAQLGKQDNNFTKEYLARGEHQRLARTWQYVLLGLLPFIGLILLPFQLPLGIAVMIGSFLFNTLYYQYKKGQLETELNSMRYLVQTIFVAKRLSKLQTPLQTAIQNYLQPLSSITKFGFSFRTKNFSESDLLMDYFQMGFMIPFIAYNFVIDKIAKHNHSAIELWHLLGKLEVAAAILNFRTYMPLNSLPEFKNGPVTGVDLFHPLVENAVANPVDWQQNTLVTGSNASGKSTYVKAIAINCLLAQTINTVTATSMQLQPGHVVSSMAVEDDLFEGDSYFVAEIKSLKRLLDLVETNQRCYCFVDEILKGTNTIERIAASASIVDWLTNHPSLAFVATHDIELTEILKNKCANVHFEEQVTPDSGITFNYQLRQGPATSRNAIALLKILDYPQAIVELAQLEAANFDKSRKWSLL